MDSSLKVLLLSLRITHIVSLSYLQDSLSLYGVALMKFDDRWSRSLIHDNTKPFGKEEILRG